MSRPHLEVADVIQSNAGAFLKAYGSIVSFAKLRVMRDILRCRTAALGGHVGRCDDCGHEEVSYNSCRNRHCPKCQGTQSAKWLDARAADLLPARYFHVVFTVPAEIGEIALQNKKVMYDILMRASAQTLLTIAADPRHLGAKLGIVSVLHTWGQTLTHHPHVHCVVPGGGLSIDGERWVSSRADFLLPVYVLSSMFRGKFLAMTTRAFADGKLAFQGKLAALNGATAFRTAMKNCYKKRWVVYSKKPFGGPEQVLKYLARYTHRVAISNHRLISCDDGRVRFRYKDYAHGNKKRVMCLTAAEFLRRFLSHVLPRGFMRIRHYGFLANAKRRSLLARCRLLLGIAQAAEGERRNSTEPAGQHEPARCPKCKVGRMIVRELPPLRRPAAASTAPVFDSS